jgi:hypothetical protein
VKGKTRTAAYIATGVGLVVFGFLFFHELHQGAGPSKPLKITYLSLMLVSLIGLVIVGVFDLKKLFSSRMERWRIEGATSTDPAPELEEAQRLRVSGEPLDAIRLLREYLLAHPYELQVMSRIAEIYRYDLKNDLAAALEYEELLKRKVPDDQWSWAALHLAKLYGRLNEFEKSVGLLERLDSQYAHTIAGRRARKALQQVRSSGDSPVDDDVEEGATG